MEKSPVNEHIKMNIGHLEDMKSKLEAIQKVSPHQEIDELLAKVEYALNQSKTGVNLHIGPLFASYQSILKSYFEIVNAELKSNLRM